MIKTRLKTKLENDIVVPMKPLFYRRFVDDVINKRRKNTPDLLLDKLNSYHPRIKFTIEVNPTRFLDTKIINTHGFITTSVHRKVTKLPTHWSSKVPKRYKRNAINGDLNRAYRIASDFHNEIHNIKRKYATADYPHNFVNNQRFSTKERCTT